VSLNSIYRHRPGSFNASNWHSASLRRFAVLQGRKSLDIEKQIALHIDL
jgi:hypothetical protein